MRKTKFVAEIAILILLMFALSCKKETTNGVVQPTIIDSSHLSITNASPDISSLLFYVDHQKIGLPDSPLAYGETTYATYNNGNEVFPVIKQLPYINISSGYHQLSFGSPFTNNSFASFSNYFQPGGSYSIFVTDSVNHGQIQYVLLQDKIGKTDTTKGMIRFLNLTPDAPPLDLWAFPNAGVYGFKIFSGCAYLANDYNAQLNAESFSTIPAGPYYFVATEAGTYNEVLEGGLFIRSQTINSIFTKGYLSGIGNQMLSVGVISYGQ